MYTGLAAYNPSYTVHCQYHCTPSDYILNDLIMYHGNTALTDSPLLLGPFMDAPCWFLRWSLHGGLIGVVLTFWKFQHLTRSPPREDTQPRRNRSSMVLIHVKRSMLRKLPVSGCHYGSWCRNLTQVVLAQMVRWCWFSWRVGHYSPGDQLVQCDNQQPSEYKNHQ